MARANMQPIEFQGKQHPNSVGPYVLGAVALMGGVAGFVLSFPSFALGWAVIWGGLGYLTYCSQQKEVRRFKIKLDDLGIEIQNKRGSYRMTWTEIDIIQWEHRGAETGANLVFNARTQRYVYDRLLNEMDFSDFIQALKLKLPGKTRDLGSEYYNTHIRGLVAAARKLRSLKQPDKAEECYQAALAAGEKAASALGLGMIPVLEEYAALLERQGKHAEAQTLTGKIALLRSGITS